MWESVWRVGGVRGIGGCVENGSVWRVGECQGQAYHSGRFFWCCLLVGWANRPLGSFREWNCAMCAV